MSKNSEICDSYCLIFPILSWAVSLGFSFTSLLFYFYYLYYFILRMEGFILAYSLRLQSIMVKNSWWQGHEAVCAIAFRFGKQKKRMLVLSLLNPPDTAQVYIVKISRYNSPMYQVWHCKSRGLLMAGNVMDLGGDLTIIFLNQYNSQPHPKYSPSRQEVSAALPSSKQHYLQQMLTIVEIHKWWKYREQPAVMCSTPTDKKTQPLHPRLSEHKEEDVGRV